ncbi:MAG: 3-deoxy-manno-octulosonate cytidylyltransferase [Saprospiraceae bacterium]
MKVLGVIPARYASARFPGKPLALIKGRSMIEHVYRGVGEHTELFDLVVATDDQRIYDAVLAFGGKVIMTSDKHTSGTSRCIEVSQHYTDIDWIINVQGDEPLFNSKLLDEVIGLMKRDHKAPIITMLRQIEHPEDAFNTNIVKCVFDRSGRALYFSRSPIPHVRQGHEGKYYQHLGIYAYKKEILSKLTELEPTPLEALESLEQLRWLEHGLSIQTGITEYRAHGVDVPEDIGYIERILDKKENHSNTDPLNE